MMSAPTVLVLGILTVICASAYGWQGNFGSRTICAYTYRRVCSYRTWLACCAYRTVRVPNYSILYFCKPGWKETSVGNQNCRSAICKPVCKNGGTCVQPDKCNCGGSYTGPTCEGKLCSHEKPCYPGECTRNRQQDSTCTCNRGFRNGSTSSGCKELISPKQMPEIFQCRLRVSNYNQQKQMEVYGLLLDSSDINTNSVEIWTNRGGFNRINYTGIASYDPPDLSPVPSDYISEAKLGIVGGNFTVNHKRFNGREVTASRNDIRCPEGDVSNGNPVVGVYNCTLVNQNYDFSMMSGDTLEVTFTAEAGGFRKLKDIDTDADRETEYYTQTTMTKSLTYRFDFKKPTHCFPSCNSPSDTTPLSIGDAFTKNPTLNLKWSGWQDTLSGVSRYVWEIFKVTEYRQGELREPDPLAPISITEINSTANIQYPTFTLPEPGLYSVILQVADNANNSEYVRRFCLYDPYSTIQLSQDANSRLRVSSASSASNYTWQDKLEPITVTWTNYFFNKFLEENNFLNEILEYPTQFSIEGLREEKRMGVKYKDTSRRQAVINARGIVEFKIGFDRVGVRQQVPDEPSKWKNISNPVSTSTTINENVLDGDTYAVYVRAEDAMGNIAIEHTLVHFDTSPPTVRKIDFKPSKTSASVTCSASDLQSGIALIRWIAVRLDTGSEYTRGDLLWPHPQQSCSVEENCDCIEKINQCFKRQAILAINNCKLELKGLNNSVTVEVHFSVLNQAMIASNITKFKINDIRELTKSARCEGGTDSSGLSGGAIAGIIIVLIFLIILAILVFLFVTNRPPFTKERKSRSSVYIQNKMGAAKTQHHVSSAYPNKAYEPEDEELYLYGGQDYQTGQSWQIPHANMTLLGTITEGKFAKIYQAKIKSKSQTVVAKMLKEGYTEEDELLMRAKINYMSSVVGKHPNIMEAIGAVVDNSSLGPVLVLEYCEGGQLDKWLVSQGGKVTSQLLEQLQQIALDVGKGMTYLASKKIVHKKLAARNVLLTSTKQVKITGFGPSRTSTNTSTNDYDNNSSREKIPIKWTALECLESLKDANEKSDVWSYGIVLWEIFSLGEAPYSDMKSREVENRVKEGHRMSKPELSEELYYQIMTNCWQENPRKRENFKKITDKVVKTFRQSSGDPYYYQS